MKKVKSVVTEKFVGNHDLEEVLISAFQTEQSENNSRATVSGCRVHI